MGKKRASFPRALTIAARRVVVERAVMHDLEGDYDRSSAMKIRISDELTGDSAMEALLHESLHALLHLHGGDYLFFEGSGDAEERFVRWASPAIHAFLKSNPHFCEAYLAIAEE